MPKFIIATDSHVIQKSEVMIVSPLRQCDTGQFFFNVTVSTGLTIRVNCCNKLNAIAYSERDQFLRSLTE